MKKQAIQYLAFDVQATVVASLRDESGKVVLRCSRSSDIAAHATGHAARAAPEGEGGHDRGRASAAGLEDASLDPVHGSRAALFLSFVVSQLRTYRKGVLSNMR
ncbi:MAG TPA: hypothetical protein VEK79_05160 [Thermoanaerobaculia bacterium]|nr:hypothetical protein [Thermoanaerobaculia bacterium]